jgi:MFS family permease
VPSIVPRAEFATAIALDSALFQVSRFIGPTIAGFIVAAWGETACFVVDGVSYVAVVGALLAMRVDKRKLKKAVHPRMSQGLKDGLGYAAGTPTIRAMLLLLFVFGFFGMPHSVLLPVFAKEVLHGGASTLGYLTAASGLGAVLGALVLATRSSPIGLGRLIVGAGLLFACGLAAFASSRLLPLSLLTLVLTGFGMMTQMVSGNTIIQTVVDEDKRGRVMSLYTSAFMGSAPFGGLLAGWLAERIGAPVTLGIAVVPCLLATWRFSRRVPDVTAALKKATTVEVPPSAEAAP